MKKKISKGIKKGFEEGRENWNKGKTNIYTNTGTVVNSSLKTTVTHTTQGEDIDFGSSSFSENWRQYSGLLWKDNNAAAAKEIHEFN